MSSTLNIARIRSQFPAFQREVSGRPVVYTDGPAGSQVPLCVAQAVSDYLLQRNANHGGCFATSVESDELLHRAHRAMAAFLGVEDADCIVFGNNMTTLTLAFSRALARTWNAGDEIILSRCDHDANVTPWVLAAQDRGVTVKWIEVQREDCTLNLESLMQALSSRTKLVAVGLASNAVGTVHPVREIADLAHAAGALVFVDAVHFAPHGLIDAASLGADFVVCSAYKFFGPHVGILWGRREHLERLTPYKVRPAEDVVPGRWMTGTQNHEGIAGVLGAVEYLASVGGDQGTLRERLIQGYGAIGVQEHALGERFLRGVTGLRGWRVWGLPTMQGRVTTFGLTHATCTPREASERLAAEGIFTWSGNFYALPLTEALGLEPAGMLRIGFLHYNTVEEVDRVLAGLGGISDVRS